MRRAAATVDNIKMTWLNYGWCEPQQGACVCHMLTNPDFPPWSIAFLLPRNCQSVCTKNTIKRRFPCEVLPSCVPFSSPSACTPHNLSDVTVTHYVSCIPQAAHAGRETERCRWKERQRERDILFILFPALILFIQRICFSLRNPPLIPFHLSLWSQFSRFTEVTSENISLSLSHFVFLRTRDALF